MRQIILNLATSFDGFIEGPNGEIDWLETDLDTDFGDILSELLSDKDTIFYGRVSYDKWGNTWPDENASEKTRKAYELLHSKTKYVFSTTKTSDDTGAIFINDNIKEKVLEIKNQPGKNIWLYGGTKLITTFLNLDLIDEYRIAVYPIILGKGRPLFENIEQRHKLILVETQVHKSGVVFQAYKTDRSASSQGDPS
ncbi:MAG: dihydrofolate reductase family protein [Chitinophagaceae bacterium]